MSKSEQTKKYRIAFRTLTVISWVLVLGPLVGYLIYAMIVSGTVEKAGLMTSLFVSLVLTAISVILKLHIRSTLFILLLGVYLAIREISVLLIIMSVCTVLDEFLITPLQKVYQNKLRINKEMDKRDSSK